MVDPKGILRPDVQARVLALSAAERASASAAIVERLAGLEMVHKAKSVLCYCPMEGEPDISPFAQQLIASGVQVAAPMIDWEARTMQAGCVRDWPGDLVLGSKGVRVPKPGSAVLEAGSIDVVLVPGVAFDRTGGRLGRGGGFYDRYLVGVEVRRRVGVCFGCQVVELVPTAGHDARVGVVVSEG